MKSKVIPVLALALLGLSLSRSADASDYTLVFPNYIQINGPDTPVDTAQFLFPFNAGGLPTESSQ